MPTIEGELWIRLQCLEGSVNQVEILSSRPLQLTRVFKGKSVDELLRMIPMLYSVCGTAQAAAAVQACRVGNDSLTVLLEQMLVNMMEKLSHYLTLTIKPFASVLPRQMPRRSSHPLIGMAKSMKPALGTHPLICQLMQKYGQGLMTRFAARLLELASLPGRLTEQLRALQSLTPVIEKSDDSKSLQQGVGEVEAARGRLIHRAVLQDDVIASYQILAPTEWNFHPQGVVARGLKRLSAEHDAKLKLQADLLIGAVDPCVGYRLEIV